MNRSFNTQSDSIYKVTVSCATNGHDKFVINTFNYVKFLKILIIIMCLKRTAINQGRHQMQN